MTGTISFSHQDYISQTLSYTGTIGQTIVLTDVVLMKNELTVTGKVILEHRDSYLGVEVCSIEDVCVTTNEDGFYILDHLPISGTVTIKHPYYLTQTHSYAGEAGELINLSNVELVLGDLNSDGQIDIIDATIISQYWNIEIDDENWDARADLTQDGIVNIFDFVIVQRNWGKESVQTRARLTNRALAGSETQVFMSPESSRLFTSGESVTMEVKVQDVSNLQGASLVVKFDPSLLQVVDANQTQSGIQIQPGNFLDEANQLIVVNRVDNEAGIIEFAVTQTYLAEARNGDGVLASITFDSIGEGHSTVSLTEVRLVDNSTPDPQVIPVTMQNGSVLVGQQKLYLPMMSRP